MFYPIDMVAMERELRRDEGCRDHPYRDSLGNWTIGVGHRLSLSVRFPDRLVWNERKIEETLLADIQAALALIQTKPWFHQLNTDPRRRALVNMSFNLGHKLDQFHTFLHYIEEADFASAAWDLKHTLWARQVGDRADRIMEQIISG